ncbi:HIT domain-containing protein [Ancylobacter sp. A5.8]|uniref:HIT domain-containing protein n=1 Tax=Ancylobacter gelatini TaxID=2919920 RepID=UPI001F4EA5B9|nr:HIT domain-containing protein [Ancylobacter gelatini]MCJ8142748.1 HIT domain-containing protein [Ancylobacter gelatini]
MSADSADFRLDERLAADTLPVGDLALCRVLLMNDARYPWLILVPRRAGLAELIELEAGDRAQASVETDCAARVLKTLTGCDKLNVAALGNMVRQLHIHVVARFEGDAAWPAPVWGRGAAEPYAPAAAELLIARLRTALEID